MIHLLLHVLVPGGVAFLFYRKNQWKVWAVLAAGILLDVDHLWAVPIYDPDRCSIGFHTLHTYPAIALYGVLLLFPKVRILALGFLIHMALDYIACL
ncbi:DUF6122 family protein [Rufibacter latericius]|uniref:Metal-dependent hydrolase n=1 Tax=Rufibacter latericius TaxID=2487040 RepID=A0A3M9MET2_9BACT|nr:DUF6122 family protein [Rufibacter latericius]RNI24069.1 hypothetical protein EFB08_16975 [Rufibacter latericius]